MTDKPIATDEQTTGAMELKRRLRKALTALRPTPIEKPKEDE